MADGTSGVDSPMIDPLIERAKFLGLGSREVLKRLGIGLLESHEGEDESSVALRTAQELLKPAYRLLVKEVVGTDSEDLDGMDEARLGNPQAFIDSTLGLMTLYVDGLPSTAPEDKGDISLNGAISATCLLEPENHSKKTVEAAQKAVLTDPHAANLLPKLQALIQAPPTK